MAKYAIFSDLHLGDGTDRDWFGRKDYLLMRIFSKLLAKGYVILLNGDVYEFWKNSEREIFKAHRVLVEFIRHSPGIVCLVGNHDYDVMGHFTFQFSLQDGRQVLVSHGFQNDRWVFHPLMKFLVILASFLERFFSCPLEKVFSTVYSDNFDKNIERNTVDYAKKMLEKYDVVICGHTHIQDREEFPGNKLYLNSGHCTGLAIQYIKINTKKNSMRLINKQVRQKKS